eukprot:5152373-Pleurochrysis_carterae.AAC.1
MVTFGPRGQNAKQSASIAISLGYCDLAYCVTGFDARNGDFCIYLGTIVVQISPSKPPNTKWGLGHGQAFTAVYAEGGICGISPATRSDAAMFYVVPVAANVKTIVYGAPRHIRM